MFIHFSSWGCFIFAVHISTVTTEVTTSSLFQKKNCRLAVMIKIFFFMYYELFSNIRFICFSGLFPFRFLTLRRFVYIGGYRPGQARALPGLFIYNTLPIERSFSSHRWINTYLCSKINEDRLSSLVLLHINRDPSSKLWNEMDQLAIEFAQQHRN